MEHVDSLVLLREIPFTQMIIDYVSLEAQLILNLNGKKNVGYGNVREVTEEPLRIDVMPHVKMVQFLDEDDVKNLLLINEN